MAPLGAGLLPSLGFSQVGLIASWRSDEDLDRFLGDPSLSAVFADGWHVRMRPLRVAGSWPQMPGLPDTPLQTADEEPVVVLTLGRLRRSRALPFLRASAPAEAELESQEGLLMATGLAHPPSLVSTFSLWRTAAQMRAYAHEQASAHMEAVRRDRSRAFHHQSAFIRFRPYGSAGRWGSSGDPLAGLLP